MFCLELLESKDVDIVYIRPEAILFRIEIQFTQQTQQKASTTDHTSKVYNILFFFQVTLIHVSRCLSDTFSSTSPRPTLRLLSRSTPPSSRLWDSKSFLVSLKAWLALAQQDPSSSFFLAKRPPMLTLPFKLPVSIGLYMMTKSSEEVCA